MDSTSAHCAYRKHLSDTITTTNLALPATQHDGLNKQIFAQCNRQSSHQPCQLLELITRVRTPTVRQISHETRRSHTLARERTTRTTRTTERRKRFGALHRSNRTAGGVRIGDSDATVARHAIAAADSGERTSARSLACCFTLGLAVPEPLAKSREREIGFEHIAGTGFGI